MLPNCKINGQKRAYEPITIRQILKRYQENPNHVIIELNGKITKDLDYQIQENDEIEWAYYMAGGH